MTPTVGEEAKEMTVEQTLAQVDVKPDQGLSSAEVVARQKQFGYNEIPEKGESLAKRILKRFWGPIPWMIEVAAILSAAVQKWEDFTIILILLLVNVIIDFNQESKALSALKVLKNRLARKAIVRRDGEWKTIDAREIVPGDIVKLRLGNIIPADVKLIEGHYLQVDQSALTGESLPVDKKSGESAFGNSVIKKGEMIAVVTATAMETYFGKTVALVAQAEKEQKSHFQKAVLNVGNYLIMIAAAMVVIIFFSGIFRHDPISEILRFSLVLAVASIPVALPAVLSVTMAVGALELAKRQAIVSRLVAIEELAGMDVLCSDKTGTLTKNEMRVADPVLYHKSSRDDLLRWAALASREEDQDPLEVPIYAEVKRRGMYEQLKDWTQKTFTPFDPITKRTKAVVERAGTSVTVTKGAPQAVLALCHDDALKTEVTAKVDEFAAQGYRTLGVALKDGGASFHVIGLLPFYDPPRDDSKSTIQESKSLGVAVKMITGDNLAIAKQIATMLGIGGSICDIQDLRQEQPKEYLLIAEVLSETLYRTLKPEASAQEVAHMKQEVIQQLEHKLHDMLPEAGYVKKT